MLKVAQTQINGGRDLLGILWFGQFTLCMYSNMIMECSGIVE